MFPAFGFLINFCIPLAGLVLALALLFIRRLRFLAAYACFIPMFSAWGAFVALTIVGERVAVARVPITVFIVSIIFAFGAGALGGALLGAATAFGINRASVKLFQGLSKA